MKEQFKESFKEEIISRIKTGKIEQSGYTLTAQKRKKLLEMDPVLFNSESCRNVLNKYISLQQVVEIIGKVSVEYQGNGAFDSTIEF
jgi:hypothetical protein